MPHRDGHGVGGGGTRWCVCVCVCVCARACVYADTFNIIPNANLKLTIGSGGHNRILRIKTAFSKRTNLRCCTVIVQTSYDRSRFVF
jgi:hypothetical protein